ncbi:MAG: hypothetical protein K6F30_00285 [Lachnospiraceae bacterium]|nr:hypothetical protein [Lachnospiraceae bacterium]
MRSKHFLRGMGVGILVTVIIFAVALVFYEPTLSEEEIKKQATALGMVMSEETDTTKEDSTDESDTTKEDSTDESDTTKEDSTDDGTTEKESTEENSSDESTAEENTSLENSNSTTTSDNTSDTESGNKDSSVNLVQFIISSGEGSSKISENLYRAGLIDDPNTFNQYLEDNGYDKTISTGSYEIPTGSTYEEIANAISK